MDWRRRHTAARQFRLLRQPLTIVRGSVCVIERYGVGSADLMKSAMSFFSFARESLSMYIMWPAW